MEFFSQIVSSTWFSGTLGVLLAILATGIALYVALLVVPVALLFIVCALASVTSAIFGLFHTVGSGIHTLYKRRCCSISSSQIL